LGNGQEAQRSVRPGGNTRKVGCETAAGLVRLSEGTLTLIYL